MRPQECSCVVAPCGGNEMAVSADKILTTTFDTVFGLLNANVISVVDASSNTVTLVPWSTGNYWTGAWPNYDIDNKASYPCAVLHSATTNEDYVTYGSEVYEVSIRAEVVCNKGQNAALFAEKVMKEMRDYEKTILNAAGLKLKSSPTIRANFFMRDRIRLHSHLITFTFEVIKER